MHCTDLQVLDHSPTFLLALSTTVPEKNMCLDIHNNLQFSPRLCPWAVDQKLADTSEHLVQDSFPEFAYRELKEYVNSRSELQDSFYKRLVINT